MPTFKRKTPNGFDAPTKYPTNEAEAAEWQSANRTWWEKNPMRYDWTDQIQCLTGSKEYFNEIDRRFFEVAKVYVPQKRVPFDGLIDFDSLRAKDVLEIGVGCGSHAALLAGHARSFTGIDLTEFAVQTTSQRLKTFGLSGQILRMDAEKMEFADGKFDFIWSWGVIHCSANTSQVLKQMYRVLRPGGTAMTMVYNRGLWAYYFCEGLVNGIIGLDLLRTRSLHRTAQEHTDGAFSRFYSAREWRKLAESCGFSVSRTSICGPKTDLLPLPASAVKNAVLKMIPDGLSRVLTNDLKMGYFLVTELQKKQV